MECITGLFFYASFFFNFDFMLPLFMATLYYTLFSNGKVVSFVCPQIDMLDGDGAYVRFLRKQGSTFVWPTVEGRYFVNLEEILEVLPVPTIDRRGRHTF